MSSFPGFYGDEGEKQQPGLLPNSDSRWCVCDPLPPSAALPLTEGENKVLTLQALISPSLGGDASEASEGVAHTPS